MRPLCIELFCGMFGWSAGWLALGGVVGVGSAGVLDPLSRSLPSGTTQAPKIGPTPHFQASNRHSMRRPDAETPR